ncbi:MAG TPA: tetratricopeptide repeat protein, partial [Chroococcales cyanobacterium]
MAQSSPARPTNASDAERIPPDTQEAVARANLLNEQALAAYRKRAFEQAVSLADQASKAAPGYWLPHETLAYLFNELQYGPSLYQALQAVRCDHPPLAETNLGLLLETSRQYEPAIAYFQKALQSDSNSWRAALGLAESLKGMEKFDQSEKARQQVKVVDTDAEGMFYLAESYRKIGNYEKAKEVCRRALKAANSDADTHARLLLRTCLFKSA